MNKSGIGIGQSSAFSSLFVDYIEHPEKLREFYNYSVSISSFRQAIADKGKETIDRRLLVDVLKKQYRRANQESAFSPGRPEVSNLELLMEPSTFTVCTGHQLCLFTGPLYFIYKIITTINLAAALKKNYPDFNFVPVYWMATEDHDFEEINHVQLFGKKLVWERNTAISNGKQMPAGAVETKTLTFILAELKTILGEGDHSKALLSLLEKAYLGNITLGDATRSFVHELFGKYGLLILDPDDIQLKGSFSEIMKDDLVNHTNYKIVNSTIQQFNNAGISVQVNPREINCFYLKDGLRRRIVTSGSEPVNRDTEVQFSTGMLEELKMHPEYFSPNVVLRPLYQEKILPNLAYVGGPGEIAYWLEFKKMFDHHRINFPVLLPRNFVLLLDAKTVQQWDKFGFTSLDYFSETDTLAKSYVRRNSGIELSLKMEQEQLTELYAKIAGQVERIDATLKASVFAEQQKAINALQVIEAKLLKAEKQKSETVINQIKKIKDKLFPVGQLQERYENFIPYYLKYGPEFIEMLQKELDPLEKDMIILSE